VDNLVRTLYLTSFDLPPVDHIRAIVEHDREIRGAVAAIVSRQGSQISDAVRRRLYLSGITKSDSVGDAVQIKNKIIESALNEKWLFDVERRLLSKLELARMHLRLKRYEEAASVYKDYLSTTSNVPGLELVSYELGRCLFESGNLVEACSVLEAHSYRPALGADLYVEALFILANCKLLMAKWDECIKLFERIIEDTPTLFDSNKPSGYFGSCLNVCNAYFAVGGVSLYEKMLRVSDLVIRDREGVYQAYESAKSAESYISTAYFNVWRAHAALGDVESAASALDAAIPFAPPEDKLSLLVHKLAPERAAHEKDALLAECVELCIGNQLKLKQKASRTLGFSAETLILLLFEISGQRALSPLQKLGAYESSTSDQEISFSTVLRLTIYRLFSVKRAQDAFWLLSNTCKYIGDNPQDPARRQLITLGVVYLRDSEAAPFDQAFISDCSNAESNLETFDGHLRVIYNVFSRLAASGRFDEAQLFLNRARAINFADAEIDSTADYGPAIFEYLQMELDTALGRQINSDQRLLDISARLQRVSSSVPRYFPSNYRTQLLKRLSELRPQRTAVSYSRTTKKIGRNELVTVRLRDGSVVTDKFKRLQHFIVAEGARIVESESGQ